MYYKYSNITAGLTKKAELLKDLVDLNKVILANQVK